MWEPVPGRAREDRVPTGLDPGLLREEAAQHPDEGFGQRVRCEAEVEQPLMVGLVEVFL
jgi:hypothetical protein